MSLWIIKMLKYDRNDISEGIDVKKTDKSKECMLCHYWYFLDKKFTYGPYLCDGCYNIMQKFKDFKNIAIVCVKKSAYRIYFLYISKREAKKLMIDSNLINKNGILWMIMIEKFYDDDENDNENKNENENENEIMN